MRNDYLRILYLLSVFFFLLPGCRHNDAVTPQNGGNSGGPTTQKIQIENVIPWFLPAVPHDSFDVTMKGYNISQAIHVHLEVRKHDDPTCVAFTDSTIILSSAGPTATKKLYTDSLNSTCVGQNSILRISVWFIDSVNDKHRDSVYYQWGTPSGLDPLTISLERWRMPSVTKLFCDTISKSIVRSFNAPDSNFLKTSFTFDSIHVTPRDTIFDASDRGYLRTMCNQYSHDFDSNAIVHNKIYFAKTQTFDLYMVGFSDDQGSFPPNGTENWSYIFMKNIDSACKPGGIISNFSDTSYANLTCIHELLHQLGSMDEDRGHVYHSGYLWNNCALWNDDSHFLYELKNHKYTSIFRTCTQHVAQLRTFRGVLPFDNANISPIFTRSNEIKKSYLTIAGKADSSAKYSMNMKLQKNEFKKYEPVIANFELINHDIKPLVIYRLFVDYTNEPDMIISDNNNNVYSSNNGVQGSFISAPSTIIQPNDTLLFSMPINNWGHPTQYAQNRSLDEVYFDQFGYFPPGDYKASFYFDQQNIEKYGTTLVTNEVSFKVTDLNEEDEEILRMYKQNKYEEILTSYPDNPFAEHVWEWKLLPYWSKVTDNTESDYNQFISKYPNSSYLLYWRFILPYIVSAESKKGNFENGIDYLLGMQSNSSAIYSALKNKPFITIIKSYGKQLEEYK